MTDYIIYDTPLSKTDNKIVSGHGDNVITAIVYIINILIAVLIVGITIFTISYIDTAISQAIMVV